jgi:NAD(P)-dependent dehydrogenase (short-subunit alcohol dehydrogenase family)
VICNNAGVVTRAPAWEQSLDDWRWVLDVDLWGVIHGVRTFVPILLSQGEPGHVVNTASIVGLMPMPLISPYAVAKAGMVALSESLHHELRQIGSVIGVSVLCPGTVPTGIAASGRNRPGGSGSAEPLNISSQLTPLPTALTPEDVAGQVVTAIRADRFWIVTHDQYFEPLVDRAAGMAKGSAPAAPPVY